MDRQEMDQAEKVARFKRIRRLKKWMRPLPRRSNVHRYPVLKWFSKIAYDRSYLWSFKGNAIVSALFWGMWIAFLPVVGLQMLIVFFVALAFVSSVKQQSRHLLKQLSGSQDRKVALCCAVRGC